VICRRLPLEAQAMYAKPRKGLVTGILLVLLFAGIFARLRRPEAAAQEVAHAPQALAAGRVSIELWGAPWCGVCRRAKAWLDAKGIPYVANNIDADPDARARLRGFPNVRSIPAWKIDDQVFTGFSEESLARIIAEAAAKRTRAQPQPH